VHVAFWVSAAAWVSVAYIITNAAYWPSDRYFVVIMFSVAATVPLLSSGTRHARRMVAGGVAVFASASLVALATSAINHDSVIIHGADVTEMSRIETLVHHDHLRVGYAGYWNAASLSWSSDGQLHVYPLLGNDVHAAPMYLERVAAWYRPRPHTPTYLILSPNDFLPDRLPSSLPRPAHTVHLGNITVDIWPYDIAAYFSQSPIPIPGITTPSLQQARRTQTG
jgi:hypothetical protein